MSLWLDRPIKFGAAELLVYVGYKYNVQDVIR